MTIFLKKINKYVFQIIISVLALASPVFAYEDCIISTNGKLTDITIQYNNIIDVFPLINIANDKNMLIVHPLKEGQTKFSVLKNGKEKFFFNVNVTKEETKIDEVSGFEIFTLDCPPGAYEYYFDIDEPPMLDVNEKNQIEIDEPPALKEG